MKTSFVESTRGINFFLFRLNLLKFAYQPLNQLDKVAENATRKVAIAVTVCSQKSLFKSLFVSRCRKPFSMDYFTVGLFLVIRYIIVTENFSATRFFFYGKRRTLLECSWRNFETYYSLGFEQGLP